MSNKYTKEDILNFLRTQFIMEIATAKDNKPSASVLLFTVDDDLNIYFATHKDSYKSQNLLENPQVSGNIWKHGKMLVQFDGKTELVSDPEESSKVLDNLAEATTKEEAFWPPVFRIKGGDYAIFKIKPYWMRALDLEVNTVSQKDSPFTEVELNN